MASTMILLMKYCHPLIHSSNSHKVCWTCYWKYSFDWNLFSFPSNHRLKIFISFLPLTNKTFDLRLELGFGKTWTIRLKIFISFLPFTTFVGFEKLVFEKVFVLFVENDFDIKNEILFENFYDFWEDSCEHAFDQNLDLYEFVHSLNFEQHSILWKTILIFVLNTFVDTFVNNFQSSFWKVSFLLLWLSCSWVCGDICCNFLSF